MEKVLSQILSLVKRQKIEFNQSITGNLHPRDGVTELEEAMSSPLVKVILGPRRCGKSTLAKTALAHHQCAYLNFEDEAFPEGSDVTGDAIMKALTEVYPSAQVFFFDEIQNFPRWEQFVHRLHREGRNVVLTGSNAHLLSQELASALTGRHIAIKLLPFSYKEFLGKDNKDSSESFLTYLTNGGYPDVVTGVAKPQTYLGTLWDSIIYKDVVRRHKIRNVQDLNALFSLMLHSMAARFSNESLVRSLNNSVSAPTVKKFLMYGQQAYLFAEVPRFHYGARKRLKFDRKAYLYDNGFLAAKKISSSPDFGKLLENLVFIELVRRGFEPGLGLFYFVTQSGHEVDFLTRVDGQSTQLIQVAWKLTDGKTRERELRSLVDAAKELGLSSVTILTHEESDTIHLNGLTINIEPIRSWMLN